MGGLLWSAAGSKVADVDLLLAATPLNAQEAFIRISLLIATADGLVLVGAHPGTALERERGQTSFRGHNENVLAAVFLPHVTLGLVELVVRTADEAASLLVASGVTVRRHDTVLKGYRHDPQATGLLFHLAHTLVGVSVGPTNGLQFFLFCGALGGAIPVVLAQSRARSNVGQLDSAPEIRDCGLKCVPEMFLGVCRLYLQASRVV